MTNHWQRFVVAFDTHGDKQHAPSIDAFLRFCAIWKPKYRIHGGDAWDFRPLRRKVSEDERRQSMRADFEAGNAFLERFRPTHFVRGNHDERLWELAAEGNGVLSDYAIEGTKEIARRMKALKCQMLPYHKRTGILKIGHLKIMHGFNHGLYAARATATIYGSVLFGHVHTIDEHSKAGLERCVARSCGCLCELDHDYNARMPSSLRHAHGFPFGVVNSKTGFYHVWQAEEIGGQWIIPTDTVEL